MGLSLGATAAAALGVPKVVWTGVVILAGGCVALALLLHIWEGRATKDIHWVPGPRSYPVLREKQREQERQLTADETDRLGPAVYAVRADDAKVQVIKSN